MPKSIKTEKKKKAELHMEVVLGISLGRVHLARLSVMTLLILPAPTGLGGNNQRENNRTV